MDNIKQLYEEYKNKIDDLVYGIIRFSEDKDICIDLNEEKIKCILKKEDDISTKREYSEGDMIYGCIKYVKLEENKIIIFIQRNTSVFLEKLFLEQALYMDIDDLKIKDINYTHGNINIYLDETYNTSYHESSLDSAVAIVKEELNVDNIQVCFGELNQINVKDKKVETTIVRSIDKNIEKGTIIEHKEYGVCKVIFKIKLKNSTLIGLKLDNENTKVIHLQ